MSDTGWGRKEAGAPAQGTKRDGGRGRQMGPAWPGHVTPPVSGDSTVLSRDGVIAHCQAIIINTSHQ